MQILGFSPLISASDDAFSKTNTASELVAELLYVSVLYCIDEVVIAALMHCDLFEIYCAPPNLGITRT